MRLKLSLKCGIFKVQGLDTHGPSLWFVAQSQIDKIKINITNHDVDYTCNTLLSHGMPRHHHKKLSCC